MDNFANHPLSITEAKAAKDEKSQTWTPRDCLISLLREIDEGRTDPKILVIAYAMTTRDDEGGAQSAFKMATPAAHKELGVYTAIGVLESVRDLILEQK